MWFSIQANYSGHLKRIPWVVIRPHEAQALKNHYQSLEKLASRGGLDCAESVAVLTDSAYPQAEASCVQTPQARKEFCDKYDRKLREIIGEL